MPQTGQTRVNKRSSGFLIQRGTNLSHMFVDEVVPCGTRRGYFTKSDIRQMTAMGLDHVRIPIAEERFWDTSGNSDSGMFALLEETVDLIVRSGLRAILCLHSLRSHPSPPGVEFPALFNDINAANQLCGLWGDLSRRFSGISCDWLAYEILNEPLAPDDTLWNNLWHFIRKSIREKEPDRVLVVGSNAFQFPEKIKRLEVPTGDRNLLLSFHFYHPFLFSHYRASWMPSGSYQGLVQYPGRPVPLVELDKLDERLRSRLAETNQPFSKTLMRKIVADAVTAADNLACSVHCGEFGCIDSVALPDRQRWYRDASDIFEDLDVPWTCWDWKGRFGLLDRQSWRASGIHLALKLKTPRWGRVPRPGPPLHVRLRRRLARLLRSVGLLR